MSDAPLEGDSTIKPAAVVSPTAKCGEVDDADDALPASDLNDAEDVGNILDEITENDLAVQKDVFAGCGFTIEDLHQKKSFAEEKLATRFLNITAYRYYDSASLYLPGLDLEEVKSVAGEKIVELLDKIDNYPSLPQLEEAFRTTIRNIIVDLQRKYLAIKRGGGQVDVTSELQGLAIGDDSSGKSTGKPTDDNDEKTSGSWLEGQIKSGYADWNALDNLNPRSQHERAEFEAKRVQQHEMLRLALPKLNAADRQLIEWFYIDRLKHREIAKKLDKGVSSIGRRIDLAEERLKNIFFSDNPSERNNNHEP